MKKVLLYTIIVILFISSCTSKLTNSSENAKSTVQDTSKVLGLSEKNVSITINSTSTDSTDLDVQDVSLTCPFNLKEIKIKNDKDGTLVITPTPIDSTKASGYKNINIKTKSKKSKKHTQVIEKQLIKENIDSSKLKYITTQSETVKILKVEEKKKFWDYVQEYIWSIVTLLGIILLLIITLYNFVFKK